MPNDYTMQHAALARLSRNAIVGLRDLAEKDIDHRHAALSRIARFLASKASTSSKIDPRRICDSMMHTLHAARLTINFNSAEWFRGENYSPSYGNMFERLIGTEQAQANVARMRERNLVEKRMIDLGGGDARPPAQRNAQHMRNVLTYYGDTDITRQGTPTSQTFSLSVRPRYGGVDFGYCTFGAAGDHRYGHSYFVLKEHVKHNATYTHTDSFKVEEDLAKRRAEYGGRVVTLNEATATYFQLEKILLYCSPAMLKHIYDYAVHRKQKGQEHALPVDTTAYWVNYIEFQAHSDIRFSRDVQEMVLYRPETRKRPGYLGYQTEKHARAFANRHGIPLRFIEYDPNIRFKAA